MIKGSREENHVASGKGLGSRIDSFKPMMGNIIAGFILGLLSCSAGVAAYIFSIRSAIRQNWDLPLVEGKELSWLVFGLVIFAGTVMLLMGAAFIRLSRSLVGLRVDIHVNGIRYRPRRSYEDIAWGEINRILETITYERPPILTGPAAFLLPKLASVSYTVFIEEKQFLFDGNTIKAIKRFGRVLKEHASRASVVWEIVESHE